MTKNEYEQEIINDKVTSFINSHVPLIQEPNYEKIIYKMLELSEISNAGTTAEFRFIGYAEAVSDIYGIDYGDLGILCYDVHRALNEDKYND